MAKIMDRVKIGQTLDQAGAGYVLSQESSPHESTAIEQVLTDGRYWLAASRLGLKSGNAPQRPGM